MFIVEKLENVKSSRKERHYYAITQRTLPGTSYIYIHTHTDMQKLSSHYIHGFENYFSPKI